MIRKCWLGALLIAFMILLLIVGIKQHPPYIILIVSILMTSVGIFHALRQFIRDRDAELYTALSGWTPRMVGRPELSELALRIYHARNNYPELCRIYEQHTNQPANGPANLVNELTNGKFTVYPQWSHYKIGRIKGFRY